MKTNVTADNLSATEAAKTPAPQSRDRIRQDKFSTLHLPCFLSDLNKQSKD